MTESPLIANAPNNTSRFYRWQLLAWGAFILFNLVARQYFSYFHFSELINSLTIGISLFCVSSLLRQYYKRVFNLSRTSQCLAHALVASVLGAIMAMALYAAVLIPNQQLIFGQPVQQLMWQQLILGSPTIAIVLMLWSSLYLVFKKQALIKHNKAQQQALDNKLKAAQLDILLSQLNPHFLFNAINNIRALTLEDSHKAREMLTILSEVMRYTMQVEKAKTIALEQELTMVKHYLALNQLQFEHKLVVQYRLSPSCLSLSLPPMVLQLLVENAIKHGISKRKQGGVITIASQEYDNYWLLSVENSGQIQRQSSSGIGIVNIKQRLAMVYAAKASFSLTSTPHDTVLATLTLAKELV